MAIVCYLSGLMVLSQSTDYGQAPWSYTSASWYVRLATHFAREYATFTTTTVDSSPIVPHWYLMQSVKDEFD